MNVFCAGTILSAPELDRSFGIQFPKSFVAMTEVVRSPGLEPPARAS